MNPDPRYIDIPPRYPEGTVVLVSGGVDSLINADTHKGVLLFVDFHYDAVNELRACRALFKDVEVVTLRPTLLSADGFFVPARNIMLASIAVHYGSHIIMGAMLDDHSVDKTPEALEMMSRVLTQHAGRHVTVRAPLQQLYKHEAVARYAGSPERRERMKQTWSCYTTGTERCFNCKACFRWSVALRWANIDVPKPSREISAWFQDRLHLLSESERIAIAYALQ